MARTSAVIVALFAFSAAAQNLSISLPPLHTSDDGGLAYYTEGTSVVVSWTSLYDQTTLSVFQQQGSGGYDAINLLAASYPKSQTSFAWTAKAVSSDGSLSGPFHFFLQNSQNASCDGCYLNSPKFAVLARTATSSSVASSSVTSSAAVGAQTSKSSSTTSKPSPTTATNAKFTSVSTNNGGQRTSTAGAASAGSSETPLAFQNRGHHMNLAIPLGVGLGAGIPVLLALIAILVMFCLRKRRKSSVQEIDEKTEEEFVAAPKVSRDTSGASTWSHSRSSVYSPEPVSEKEVASAPLVGAQQPLRHSASHPPRGAHQYRPSMAPTQEEAVEDSHDYAAPGPSHPPYLNSFDFEVPVPVELDAANQVPRSGGSSNYSDRSRQSSGGDGESPEDSRDAQGTYARYQAEETWPLPSHR